MECIERYMQVVNEYPFLFENDESLKTVKVITVKEVILNAQKRFYERADKEHIPRHFFTLGVLSEDEWYFTLRDYVIFPNGQEGAYIRFVCKKGTLQGTKNVIIIPYNENRILLTHQYRHAIRQWSWETPRGFGEKNYSPEENARKELQEEVGLEALHITEILQNQTSGNAVFLARVPYIDFLATTNDEQEVTEITWLELKELKQWILDGRITDSTILAVYIYLTENGFPVY